MILVWKARLALRHKRGTIWRDRKDPFFFFHDQTCEASSEREGNEIRFKKKEETEVDGPKQEETFRLRNLHGGSQPSLVLGLRLLVLQGVSSNLVFGEGGQRPFLSRLQGDVERGGEEGDADPKVRIHASQREEEGDPPRSGVREDGSYSSFRNEEGGGEEEGGSGEDVVLRLGESESGRGDGGDREDEVRGQTRVAKDIHGTSHPRLADSRNQKQEVWSAYLLRLGRLQHLSLSLLRREDLLAVRMPLY